MRRIALFLVMAAANAAASQSPHLVEQQAAQRAAQHTAARTWTIDPNHSTAQFAVKHMLVSTVRGQFDKVSGTVQYDGSDIQTLRVDVTIDPSSVDTHVEKRDNDLRSPAFFDVAKYPLITFVSRRVQPVDAQHFKLIGDLTMHGVTKEVALDVEGPSAPIQQGELLHLGASASAKINRHDWALNYSKMVESAPIVGDDISITIDVEATRPAP